MGRMARVEQDARARARERRIALDRDRAARDRRVEDATTDVFLAFEARAKALRAAKEAEDTIAAAMKRLRAGDVRPEQIAELCEVSLGDVRRYSQRKPAAAGNALSSEPDRPGPLRPVGDDERAAG